METGRIPPHNINAEKSVLGAFLIDVKSSNNYLHKLNASDFYLLAHQKIFEAIESLCTDNKKADIITVSDWLDTNGLLESVGGYEYITDLSDFTPITSNVGSYVDIVKSQSLLRQLIDIGEQLSEKSYSEEKPADIIEYAEQEIYNLGNIKSRSIVTYKQAREKAIKRAERRLQGKEKLFKTWYAPIDNILGGIGFTDLIIIGARPAMGKTSLALDFMRNWSSMNDLSTLFFSLEMPEEDIADKFAASTEWIEANHIKTAKMSDEEWEKYCDYDNLKIMIDPSPNKTILEIKSMARQHKCDIIVIDYLQLMQGKGDSDIQRISYLTRQLKIMALELKKPVVVLSQLSRKCEQRTNKRPVKSDLRDSGTIEQDADKILFIYRADEYLEHDEQPTGEAEIIIAKNRGGKTGTAKLTWIGEHTTFIDKAQMKETEERMPFDGV